LVVRPTPLPGGARWKPSLKRLGVATGALPPRSVPSAVRAGDVLRTVDCLAVRRARPDFHQPVQVGAVIIWFSESADPVQAITGGRHLHRRLSTAAVTTGALNS
jgi:hypothetical protein